LSFVLWTRFFGIPLTIPTELLERFPELRAAQFRRGGIFVRIGGWCLGMPSVAGITLGRTVWLAADAILDAALLLHEIRHVQQFATIWWFPVRYLWECLRRGYRANWYEVDARAYVDRRLRADRAQVYSTERL
jgi:hypothetical protein